MKTIIQNKIIETAQTLYDLPVGRFKHFSFICERNKIISVGWNKPFRTHPIAKKFGHRFSCIHSELDCINNFNYPIKSLQNYKFYNVRLYRNHTLALSKPCLHCQYMLTSFGVKEVIYSILDGFSNCQF